MPVVPIPGARAVTALLSVAGFAVDRFVFEGFLPPREGAPAPAPRSAARRAAHDRLLRVAPPRLADAREIEEILGDREAVVGRELTKLFEEILRGRISALRAQMGAKPPRGEYTIAIAGAAAPDD